MNHLLAYGLGALIWVVCVIGVSQWLDDDEAERAKTIRVVLSVAPIWPIGAVVLAAALVTVWLQERAA